MSTDTRDVLVPDPEEPPPPTDEPVADEVLSVPREGLEPRAGDRKRVVVIGAGMAGLVAAFELARQGHDPLILEAQNRVGGGVYTLRSFAPGLYAEAGAMRIPRVHELTLKYVNLFGLTLRPFMMGNPKGLVHVGGRRMTAAEAQAQPGELPFDLAENKRGRSVDDLWQDATRDLRELLEREGDAGWEQIVRDYDQYSLREFLVLKGFSEGAIEMYGVINFVEADMNNAVIEELRGPRQVVRRHAGDRRRHRHAAARLLRGAPGSDSLRRRGLRHRPGRRLGDGPLQDGGRPVHGACRLRDLRDPVLGPPSGRAAHSLLARKAACHPPAQLLGLDQDPVPGERSHLGGR